MGIKKMQILEALNESNEWKGQAFRVFFHIINYTNTEHTFYWSYQKIAEALEIDRHFVSEVFDRLEDLGFIKDTGRRLEGNYRHVKVWKVDWNYIERVVLHPPHIQERVVENDEKSGGVPTSTVVVSSEKSGGVPTNKPPKETPKNKPPKETPAKVKPAEVIDTDPKVMKQYVVGQRDRRDAQHMTSWEAAVDALYEEEFSDPRKANPCNGAKRELERIAFERDQLQED